MGREIKYPVVNGLKECGVCHLWKPIENFRKARKHYEFRCKDCLKLYAAAYRAKPEIIAKTAEYHKQYMADVDKRKAKNEYLKVRNKRGDVKTKRNTDRRDWASKQKRRAIDYKGGACVICGYNSCSAALDFHHLNPEEKEGLKQHWSFEKNKHELDKCILVCTRCHRELHAGYIKYEQT